MAKHRFDCGCEFEVVGEPSAPGALPRLSFDAYNIRPDCKATWNLLSKGHSKGVFQLESPLGKQWVKQLKPREMEHLAALGAILRPGALRAEMEPGLTMTKLYCLRVNGEAPIESFHPVLDPILASTYQVLVYQEQSMLIGRDIAGFDLREVDRLRKAIGKKDEKELSAVGELFLSKAKEKVVVPYEVAEKVWGWIKKSGRYQFNHCISGDSVIRRPNKRCKWGKWDLTVEEMYRVRHDLEYAKATGHSVLRRKWKRLGNYGYGVSMCEDGRIRPNVIEDIQPAGRLPVYKITLLNRESICVTCNHKFPTPNGELRVDELTVGMSLYFCGEYEKSDFARINRFGALTREAVHARASGSVNKAFGESNYAYTNGSYSEFARNNEIIPRVCFDCEATDEISRLELHHIDGNRADSRIGNLMRLCASCHKKRQYSMGRRKRGEKGYPSLTIQIASIELNGVEDTYDVTMGAPNHNFVLDNGIVTCNSHSLSYGVIGYITAYIKAHFPVHFFTMWLRYAQEKSEPLIEIAELVNEAKLFDVPILPPDFRTMKKRFATDGLAVRFGLSDIKGLGPSQITKLRQGVETTAGELAKPASDWTWLEVLTRFSSRIAASAMERLISVGAFDYFGAGLRTRQLEEFKVFASLSPKEKAWMSVSAKEDFLSSLRALARPKKEGGGCHMEKRRQAVLSRIQLLEDPPTPLEDLPNWVARTESELLGVALTCSEVDALDKRDVNTTCKEFLNGSNGHYGCVILGVKIESVRTWLCKQGKNQGKEMGYLTVSDASCALGDVVVFPDDWSQLKDVLSEDTCVILRGERGRKNDSLIIKQAYLM